MDKSCKGCGYFLGSRHGYNTSTCNIDRATPRLTEPDETCDQWLKIYPNWHDQHLTPKINECLPGKWRYITHRTARHQWLLENANGWILIDMHQHGHALSRWHLCVQYCIGSLKGFKRLADFEDLCSWLTNASECISI